MPHESPNDFFTLFTYQQDEQPGSDIDRASSNPYHMSIEGYFNPPEEPSTRGRNLKMVYLPVDNIFDPEKGAIFFNCVALLQQTKCGTYVSMSMASNNTPIFWHKFTREQGNVPLSFTVMSYCLENITSGERGVGFIPPPLFIVSKTKNSPV